MFCTSSIVRSTWQDELNLPDRLVSEYRRHSIRIGQQRSQIFRQLHRFQRADIGAAGITDGHPNARENQCRRDSRDLSDYFAPILTLPPYRQHGSVTTHMGPNEALAQNVRAF